jgi:hypothetical protein
MSTTLRAEVWTDGYGSDPRVNIPPTNNALAYRRGHTAGYRGGTPTPPDYAPGYESGRAAWIAGYRDGWRLAVKYGAIVSPTEPPEVES